MARPGISDNVRLGKLRAARPKAAGLKRGAVLASKPMADLLGVQWPTLRDWCDALPALEAKGAVKRGGNGTEYEFKPLRTIDLLIKHFEASVARQTKKNRDIRRAVGVTLDHSEESASFAEVKDMVGMTLSVVAAAEKMGIYTLAEESARFIEGYNQTVVNGIMGVRTQVDPNGILPPHIRTAMDDALRSLATHVHAAAEAYVKGQREGIQQAGTV
jgi:hypothetical protein